MGLESLSAWSLESLLSGHQTPPPSPQGSLSGGRGSPWWVMGPSPALKSEPQPCRRLSWHVVAHAWVGHLLRTRPRTALRPVGLIEACVRSGQCRAGTAGAGFHVLCVGVLSDWPDKVCGLRGHRDRPLGGAEGLRLLWMQRVVTATGPAPLPEAPSLKQTASVPGVWSHGLIPPSLPGSPLPFTGGPVHPHPVQTLAEALSHGVCLEGGATQLFHSSLVLSQKSSL